MFVPRKDALPGARHPVSAIIAISCAVALGGCYARESQERWAKIRAEQDAETERQRAAALIDPNAITDAEGDTLTVYTDHASGCEYIVSWGHRSQAMTPRLGPDGKPICKPTTGTATGASRASEGREQASSSKPREES